MKKIILTTAILALYNVANAEVITGTVTRVSDGDTLTVKTKTKNVTVRLARIDAPEISHFGSQAQPFGKEAGAYLREIVNGETVDVDVAAIDRYGRSVGTVMMGNENINALMVQDGYAWVYREFSKGGDDLMLLEKDARRRRIGLWSLDNPIYPSDFRKSQK